MKKKTIYNIVHWAIIVACALFLAWKLREVGGFKQYLYYFADTTNAQIVFLIFTIILLPLNFFCESAKWKILLKNICKINFYEAFQAVLWGQTGAFLTPNSLGEYPARSLNLPSEYRLSAVTMGFAGSFAQTVVVSVCGIIAAPFFLTKYSALKNFNSIIIFAVIVSLSIILLFFFLPKISKKVKEKFTFSQSLQVLAVSAVKYLIFSVQFYFMLRFCGVEFSVVQAIFAMPTFYLLLTYTPLINAAEFAVRSSIGILIFGAFSDNITAIFAASALFWLLNFCIPTLFGLFLGIKNRRKYVEKHLK
ncbi:MAG: flippase-like domain-containing protein [Prevotellaceae bacterium]|jgi:hypothetical protein|nr:flippase-like domain-containing protein [Prevotellaceae bacterium]